jgi:uncharacterized membrane protein
MPPSIRQRAVQTLIFETGGLLLATPLYEAMFGRTGESAFGLMLALTLAVLLWSPLHNLLFDALEQRMTDRLACNRAHALRLLHAISHEVTPIVITLPMIILLGRHSLTEALALNGGLTALYMVYAYAFYWLYDRIWPVGNLRVVAG